MIDLTKLKIGHGFKKYSPFKSDEASWKRGSARSGYGIVIDISLEKSWYLSWYHIKMDLYDVMVIHGEEEADLRDSIEKTIKTNDPKILKHYIDKMIKKIENL